MTINQEHFTTYKSLSPVLRTQTTSEFQLQSFSYLEFFIAVNLDAAEANVYHRFTTRKE